MVRTTKSSPESRIDLRYQLFDEERFRDYFYFVNEQALAVLVKSLTLTEPEELFSVNNQTCISTATSINSYRILRMRCPIFIKRRVGREQIQLGAVIHRSRFV